jgi:DNA repair exonuclease SbcCD nuclease subunit
MSSIVIASDVHCGVGDKLDDCIWSLRAIREYAKAHNVEVVVILGDLFHDRVNLNIKVISDVAAFFDDTKYEYNQEWLLFPGNHDMFMRHSWDVNSLKPIKRLITLIDDYGLIKIYGHRFRIIPFVQHEDVYMKVLEHINNKTQDGDVLLTHIGVSGARFNSCFLMQNWGMVNFDATRFSKVFAGHFHCNQQIGKVYIPGSPIPFKFDEGMVEHGFYDYDIDSGLVQFIDIKTCEKLLGSKAPPDFVTISEKDVDTVSLSGNNIRIILDMSKSRDELNAVRAKLESKGALRVSWMKTQEDDKSMPKESEVLEPHNLFERFVDFDKPKGLNKQLLVSLNKKIVEEAFDTSKSDDAE